MRPDEGPSYPPLPPDAGEKERALYEIYDFQSGIVSYTADQWKQTAEDLSDLAISVRGVVSQLRRAPDSGEAWSGSAAEAAYDSLGKLAANLDRHAEDITRIESGLTAAYDAVSDARSQSRAWASARSMEPPVMTSRPAERVAEFICSQRFAACW